MSRQRDPDPGPTPGAVHVSVFGKTDLGRTRDHNEDTFLVANLSAPSASLKPEVREHELGPRGTLCVVADGMGGAAAGELASAMAAEAIYEHMSSVWPTDNEASAQRFAYRMREALELANHRIHGHARENPDVRGMGTTATVVGILGQSLYLAQVGDSRAYLIRRGQTTQLTKDQSLMQRLVDAGELTEQEAEDSQRKNIILQALGPEPRITVDLTYQDLRREDTLVLCSDGLSGQVKPEEIAEVIGAHPDPAQACTTLIERANERGGPDNITVVVVRLSGDGLPAADEGSPAGRRVFELEGEDDIETEEHPAVIDEPEPVLSPRRSAISFMWVGLILALIAIALLVLR
ncbi:MAG TPA: Stp1/IreP family PP2C-type Ser/Thr phosphatase [Gemmatimonadales bacterium]|nr:Stp1/IreP family PP2C-type Ser/Thr phosphatase [Gemmatimonadales bacterium]